VQEHNPRLVVLRSRIEQLRHCRVHAHRQRILLFRSVELDSKDAFDALGQDLAHFRV